MQRTIVYDCDRLVSVLKKNTPTGIDRVDYAYLSHFFNDMDTHLVGIQLRHDDIKIIARDDIERLLTLLGRKWHGDASSFEDTEAEALALRKRLRATDLVNIARCRIARGSTLRTVPERADGKDASVFYFNASHRNMLSEKNFRAMRDRLGWKLIFFIHDLIPIDFPQFVKRGAKEDHEKRMLVATRSGDFLVFNSQYSADRFREFVGRLGAQIPPNTVLHIGVEQRFLDQRNTAKPTHPPYFLIIGTLEPRKNLRLILQVWKRLIEEGGIVPELRIAGRRGWVTDENAAESTMIAELDGHVTHLEGLNDAELMDQIRGATALLFPSLAEGWGMPLVEAATLGVPIIASDIPAFREAAQGCAELLTVKDAEAWSRIIKEHSDPFGKAKQATLDRLSIFKPPLWNDHFATFEDAAANAFDCNQGAQLENNGRL